MGRATAFARFGRNDAITMPASQMPATIHGNPPEGSPPPLSSPPAIHVPRSGICAQAAALARAVMIVKSGRIMVSCNRSLQCR